MLNRKASGRASFIEMLKIKCRWDQAPHLTLTYIGKAFNWLILQSPILGNNVNISYAKNSWYACR